MAWIVRDGDGYVVTDDNDISPDELDARVFEDRDDAQYEAERLEAKYDTDGGWFHTAWIPTTEAEFAEIRRVAALLVPRASA